VLGRTLGEAGNDVRVNARIGRSAYGFLRSEGGAAQLAEAAAWGAVRVFVFLGTNDIGLALGPVTSALERIKAAFPNAEVWGLGPPGFAPGVSESAGVDDVAEAMRVVFGARFVDLRPLTADMLSGPYRAGDGVHFTAEGGAELGRRLLAATQDAGTLGRVAVGAAIGFGVWYLFLR
jgi:lysophospholipase L1-like esterase